jgi:hypothetical protein
VILLDTTVLIDTFTASKGSAPAVRRALERGERLVTATLACYEWLRGPRLPEELVAQEALLPMAAAVPFGLLEASRAAEVYRLVRRPRGREVDLAIAACALTHEATLWTLNVDDFRDVPGLVVQRPQ